MKNFKKVLALVLAVATLLSMATIASAITSKDYKDAATIEKNGQTEAIDVLSHIGVLNGYGDGNFKPDQDITRAEAAKIIAMFDNGATDIDALYTSANPFVDAKGNWAESYIAYCYKTGIIGGIGNNMYAPASKVTGIQFLKMVLIVLGYDAKEEGLVGTSWAVNTLALAKKCNLLDNLGDKFNVSANLLRGQAAQIMLNALRAHTVEYGQAYKFTFADQTQLDELGFLKRNGYNYLTVAGAIDTGRQLMERWKLSEGSEYDVWGVPSSKWYDDGDEFLSYDATPVLTYKTEVKFCDILVDLGVAKTSTSTKTVDYVAENGALLYGTDVNSFTDDYNAGRIHARAYSDLVLKHVSTDYCLATVNGKTIGGTGALTRVYKISGKYAIVVIDTYFAQVAKVIANTHAQAETLRMQVWMNGFAETEDSEKNIDTTNFSGTWAKYDFALVYRLTETERANGKTDFDGVPGDIYVQQKSTAAATDTLKKYTVKTSTTVGSTTYPDDRNFEHGYPGTTGTTYNVYLDFYGNVIALIKPATTYSYGVIDRIAWIHNDLLDPYAKANLVFADASKGDGVTMAKIDINAEDENKTHGKAGIGPFENALDNTRDTVAFATAQVSSNWTLNDVQYENWLYQYTKTSSGKYVITDAGTPITEATVIKKNVANTVADGINTNDDTVYLVKSYDADGNIVYKSYTGYKNVPNMTIATSTEETPAITYFHDGNYVTYMYIDATQGETGFTTTVYYIASGKSVGYDEDLLTYKMFLGDVEKTLTATANGSGDFNDNLAAGLYEVTTNEAGQITKIEPITEGNDKLVNSYTFVNDVKACSGTVIENAEKQSANITSAYKADPKAFYAVDAEGKISHVADPTDPEFLLDANKAPIYKAICLMNGEAGDATIVYLIPTTV